MFLLLKICQMSVYETHFTNFKEVQKHLVLSKKNRLQERFHRTVKRKASNSNLET